MAVTKARQEAIALKSIGPAEARTLLATQTKNRKIDKKKVKQYADDMSSGRWRNTRTVIAIDWIGNLIDGQHRLNAVIQSGTAQEFIISTGHDPEDQMAMDNGKNRTTAQQLGLKDVKHATKQAAVARNVLAYDLGVMQSGLGNRGGGGYPGRSATMDFQQAEEKAILWAIELASPQAVRRTAFSGSCLHSAAFLIARVSTLDSVEEFFDEWTNSKRGITSSALLWLDKLEPQVYAGKPVGAQVCAVLRSWNDYRAGVRGRRAVKLTHLVDGVETWIPFPERILP